jgi:NAD(P)-dependent dehydrogenase (short-subunit alcohol dehydrogenase family)
VNAEAMMEGLNGKVAIVTGGADGIGRAIALHLARHGVDVGIVDVDAKHARSTVKDIVASGRDAHAVTADVRHPRALAAAVRMLEKRLGPTDILVCNAGIVRLGRLLELDERAWHETLAVNISGIFNTCRAVVPGMVKRGHGAVINIASWVGKRGVPFYGAYSASKFAVVGFTQSLALEVAPHGVRVNAVSPGLIVNTRMRRQIESAARQMNLPSTRKRIGGIPLGRVGYPDDVARVVTFLASDETGYVVGATYDITGGTWMS